MTTYQVTSDRDSHQLTASWPDLPEWANHPVASFEELKLATVSEERAQRRFPLPLAPVGPTSEPGHLHRGTGRAGSNGVPGARTATERHGEVHPAPVAAGVADRCDPRRDADGRPPRGQIEALVPAAGQEPAPAQTDSAGFTERIPVGNLRPLLWRDWCSHLTAAEHDRLAAELDAELTAMTDPLTGRGRQIAWYLSAEILIDEDHSRLAPFDKGDEGEKHLKAFQAALVRLLGDLVGLRVESTAVEWDPDNEELLRVYSPKTVVGFWLDPECWYNGWPDSDSGDSESTIWRHAGTLPTDTSIGNLAEYITERLANGTWPFGGVAPGEKRSPFGGRRRGQ